MYEYLLNFVEERGLASFTKGDLEALIFYVLVFKSSEFGEEISPQDIDSATLLEISHRFRLSGLQTRNLVARAARLYEYKEDSTIQVDIIKILKDGLYNNPESLKNGVLKFILPNPVQRNAVEESILLAKGFNDTSFNKDIMVIPFSTLIKILGKDEEKYIKQLTTELKIIQKNNPALKIEKALAGRDIKTIFLELFKENSLQILLNNFISITSTLFQSNFL